MKDPLVAPLVAAATGILLSHLVRFEARELLAVLLLLLALTLFAVRRSGPLAYAACLVTLVPTGMLINIAHAPRRAPEVDATSQ